MYISSTVACVFLGIFFYFIWKKYGVMRKGSYICSVHFEKSKTKADNNRKVPGIWSKKKIVSLAYLGKSD